MLKYALRSNGTFVYVFTTCMMFMLEMVHYSAGHGGRVYPEGVKDDWQNTQLV